MQIESYKKVSERNFFYYIMFLRFHSQPSSWSYTPLQHLTPKNHLSLQRLVKDKDLNNLNERNK